MDGSLSRWLVGRLSTKTTSLWFHTRRATDRDPGKEEQRQGEKEVVNNSQFLWSGLVRPSLDRTGDVTHLPISSIERPLLPVSSTTGAPISRDRRRNDVSRSSTNAADGKVSIRVIIHCVLAIPRCKSLAPVCG